MAAGEFSFSFRSRVPKLAIKPDTAAIDKTLSVLVLGDIPADVYAYADRIGVPVVRVLTAHRALEHLSVSPFRAVAVSPEGEGGIELVKQVKLASDFGDSEGEDAVSRNMLTPFIVLPFQGEEEYAVLVVPPAAAGAGLVSSCSHAEEECEGRAKCARAAISFNDAIRLR